MSSPNEKKFSLFLVNALAGLTLTLMIGYLVKGARIFSINDPGFQFVAYGIIGAVLLATINYYGVRNFIFMTIMLFLLQITFDKLMNVRLIFGRLGYVIVMGGAITIYFFFVQARLVSIKLGKFILLAGFIAFIEMIFLLLSNLFLEIHHFRTILFGQMLYGFLIGSGVGLGHEIGQTVPHSLWNKTET